MVDIIVNAGLVSGIISTALTKTGDFRVRVLAQAEASEVARALREVQTSMVLMNVGLHPESITLEQRLIQIRSIRKDFPRCRIVLLMDTNVGEDRLQQVVTLRQAGLIDSFLYADSSVQFLVATLQSMLLG